MKNTITFSNRINNILSSCNLCPRNCNVNRLKGELGYCRSGLEIEIASATLHFGEEPCISGERGSGTVFFSHCNAGCIYCQNYPISQFGYGKEYSHDLFFEMLFQLKNRGAENINLVTPVPQLPLIFDIVKHARSSGLGIPVVVNLFGWGTELMFNLFREITDIFLIDARYSDNYLALAVSGVDNYTEHNISFLKRIIEEYEPPRFNKRGIMTRGVIVRHMVLPARLKNSIDIFRNLKRNFRQEIYVSLMNQYFPAYKANNHPELNRRVSKQEWEVVKTAVEESGFFNGWIQEFYE